MIGVVLYCFAIDDWEPRFRRQIKRIYDSGLYENANDLWVIFSDIENNNKNILDEILSPFQKIKVGYNTVNHAESIALSKVDELCRQNEDYKVLYFHTKGVFNKYKNFISKNIDDLKVRGVNSWVEMMEFFLVDNWKICVEKLNDYDTVGVTNNQNWWWGNFWWTKSSHVRKNIPIKSYYGGSRWQCEGWLHDANSDKENIKLYEFYKFYFDGHYTVIPKYFYDGTDISDIKIEILDAYFGYYAEQRDEGRGLLSFEDKLVDVTDELRDSVESTNYKRIRNDWGKYNLETKFLNIHGQTFMSTLPKTLRVRFKTNLDPENEYIVSCFMYFNLDIGYKI